MSNKTNKLIPELRFPEFLEDGEWEEITLDKVVSDFIVPMRDKPKKLDGEIPWCRIEDFNGMYLFGSKSSQGVSLETIKEMNLKVYPVNTLLVSCSADLGRCAITQKPLVTNQTFIGLVPVIKKVDTVYLYYVMIDSSRELNARSSGTTISYLSRQQFEKFEILLSKLQEQQKIASCLSTLDEVITAHSQKLATLKDHKKGLMQNLFPQLSELGLDRLKDDKIKGKEILKSQNPKNHNSDNVPKYRFPEFVKDGEWEKIIIGDVANVSTGGTPDSTNPEYWNGEIPWMNSGELNNKRIYSVSNFITLKGLKESSTKLIPPNCVLIGLAGQGKTRGTAAINYIELCTNQSIGSIHPNKDIFNSEFLYQRMDLMYEQLRYLSAGDGGRGGLNLQIIKSIELFIPKPIEQQKIADFLSSLDELITTQAEKIAQLKLHKKGLMQGLFPKVSD